VQRDVNLSYNSASVRLPEDDRRLADLLEHYAGFLAKQRRNEDARTLEARARAFHAQSDCNDRRTALQQDKPAN